MRVLGQALLTNTNLTELDLQSNVIRDDGAEQLSVGMVENHTLKKLSLEDNFLTDVAAKMLLMILERNDDLQLREMKVRNNLLTEVILQQVELYMRTHVNELKARKKREKEKRQQSHSSTSLQGSKERMSVSAALTTGTR
eukprot:CAMPEP_0206606894 /NCGR_PEP_ID=MMETSP0325_2-20121206/51724_1 /ASSEMBLY_ACC=CAM_ASM_000347 /TAXON_ID=2866 /ORGANISM="Crypthecodinium cohnii, Strain Seligo" /LENGTH=139 /DNA_ID=CAMNT_0054123599 /DNA_START=7 /DNA_END=426 /DNA_ORIENTATION=+